MTQILRIVSVELYVLFVRTLWQLAAPIVSLLWTLCVMSALGEQPECSYSHFHLLFTIPPMAFLLEVGRSRAPAGYFTASFFWILALCAIASVYTTPWDNLLVYLGVWGYSPNRVLFEVGWVPIEEYAFFSIETLMVGGVWLSLFPSFDALKNPPVNSKKTYPLYGSLVNLVVGVLLAGLGAFGVHLLNVPSGLYLGLILSWSTPVLLLQWSLGARALRQHTFQWATCIALSFVYLCVVDRWAIIQGIWIINPRKTVPMILDVYLPLEEATFFLVTSTMCAWALTLAMLVTKRLHNGATSFMQAFLEISRW